MTDDTLNYIPIGKKDKMMLPDPIYCRHANCTHFIPKEESAELRYDKCISPDMSCRIMVVKIEKGCPYKNKKYYYKRR